MLSKLGQRFEIFMHFHWLANTLIRELKCLATKIRCPKILSRIHFFFPSSAKFAVHSGQSRYFVDQHQSIDSDIVIFLSTWEMLTWVQISYSLVVLSHSHSWAGERFSRPTVSCKHHQIRPWPLNFLAMWNLVPRMNFRFSGWHPKQSLWGDEQQLIVTWA